MDNIFKFNVNIKQEFLNSKPTGTANSNIFVLKLMDEYEQLSNKDIYNMSYVELKELLAMQFSSPSLGDITKNVSIMRKYIDFCISKNLVSHMENRLALFARDEVKQFVSKQAIEYRYTSPEELKNYQNMLYNAQDRWLLEAPYIGIRGRTTIDGTTEEIINLQIDEKSKDFKNNLLKLSKNNGDSRYLQVSDNTMQMVLDVYHEQYYISNNGEEVEGVRGGVRKSIINISGKYVLRTPGKNKFELFTPVLVNSRIGRIQEWIGNRFITIGSLYMSGMISMAKDILAQKGELKMEDYISICEQYNFGDKPDRYWLVLKDTVQQYI